MPGLCQGLGILAKNMSDLLPDGFIYPKIIREYPQGQSPTDQELQQPKVGQSFRQVPDPNIVERFPDRDLEDIPLIWEETRIQLPGTSFGVNFQFRSRALSTGLSLLDIANGGFDSLMFLGGGTGAFGIVLAAVITSGGIQSVENAMIWQAFDASTRYDIPIVLTEESKSTGVIDSPGPLAALVGVFKEPLDLSDETKRTIGKSVRTGYLSRGILNEVNGDAQWIGGAIRGTGQGGEQVTLPIFPSTADQTSEEIFLEKTLVVEVVRDDRAIAFLGDNLEIPNQPYGFVHKIKNNNPVIMDKIKIDTKGLDVGDTVYLTAEIAGERYFREKMYHRGTLAEMGFSSGGSGEILHIGSVWKIYHSHIVTTRVRSGNNIPLSADVLNEDFVNQVKPTINDVLSTSPSDDFEDLKSWRMTGMTGNTPSFMFFGDKNGIHRLTLSGTGRDPVLRSSELMISKEDIKDFDWYNLFLSENSLEDFDIEVNSLTSVHTDGLLFDISLQANILLDKEKTGYQRELADSISRIGNDPGVGISNLDLVIAGRTNPQTQASLSNFDLSSAKFKKIGETSKTSGSWIVSDCTNGGNSGSYYDSTDPLNQFNSFFSVIPSGDFTTDWQYGTPIYDQVLNTKSRIYTELFWPGGMIDRRFSLIYPYLIPSVDSSLSLDFTSNAKRCFVFFQNPTTQSLGYYMFYDGEEERALHSLVSFPEGNNIRPEFNHDEFKFLGYNIAAGDSPGYSEGQIMSSELAYICDDQPAPVGGDPLTRSDMYTDGTWIDEDTEFESTTYEISSGANNLYRTILLTYEVKDDFELKQDAFGNINVFKNGTKIGDNLMSIEFVDSNQVIDNIALPVNEGLNKINLDGQLYGSRNIKLHGDLIDKVVWKKIETTFTQIDKISPFLMAAGQTATGIDGRDYIHVFYHNRSTGNISCAVSDSMGMFWYNFKDIIRLTQGETADQPYVITDKKTNTIHLFYRLNSLYLMVKSIKTDWFVCRDQFEEYNPPEDFNAESEDLLGIEQYSEGGQSLRKQESYFVHGNSDNEFVKRQQSISEKRLADIAEGEKSSYRFVVGLGLSGRTAANMASDHDGFFSAYRDNRGSYRIFLSSNEGRISIKSSPDLREWGYDIKDMWVHRDFFTDDPDKDDMAVSNPQVIYNELSNTVYWLYFHKEGMYMRRISGEAFYPETEFFEYADAQGREEGTNEDGSFSASQNFRTEFEITEDTPVYPVFVVGKLSEKISEAARDNDEDLSIDIPFDTFNAANQLVFDDKFEINIRTKPVGYAMRSGMIRLFYRTAEGLNYGLSINGDWVRLDTQLRHVV